MQKLITKLTHSYLLLFFGVAVFVTGCKKDEGEAPILGAPTVTVTPDTKEYKPGETATIKVDVAAPGKLKEVKIGTTTITTFTNETTATGLTGTYVIPANTAPGNHDVAITVTDKQTPAKTTTSKATLKVVAPVYEAPTVTIMENTEVYYAKDTVTISMDVMAPGKFKEIMIGSTSVTTFSNETSIKGYTAEYVIPGGTAAGDHEVTVTVTDMQTPAKTATAKTVIKVGTCPNYLTGCRAWGKMWMLDPADSALKVAPNDSKTVWWYTAQSDRDQRPCQFNDRLTFRPDGSFRFETNGDMWVDSEGDGVWPRDIGVAVGCHPVSAIKADYQAWGSGNHTFELTEGNLKVIGKGAHLGVYKAGETQTTAMPEEFINYEIVSLTENKLVVKKTYSWGHWRFTYVPVP